MKNNTNIFERISYLSDYKGFKNLSELAEYVGYKSAEKFYRLNRGAGAKPSFDMLEDFSNKFENLDLNWFVNGIGQPWVNLEIATQNKAHTPNLKSKNDIVSEPNLPYNDPATLGKTDTPTDTPTQKLSPKNSKNLSPNLSPTGNLGMPKVVAVNENNEDLVSLVSAKAAAGYLNGYADTEYVENLPTIRLPNLKGGTHRAFEVSGHSMQPTIHNGSVAVGRWVESLEDIRDRRIYILVTKSYGIVIKRVLNRINEGGNLILISDNPNKVEYRTYPLDASEIMEAWYLRGAIVFNFQEPNELYNRFNDLEATVVLMQSQLQKLL